MSENVDLQMQTLWAKTGKENVTHLLVYHLIDVAEVAHLLWDTSLGVRTHALFSQALSLDEEQAGWFLAFILGLHDLGKASPAFQKKYEPIVPRLQELGLPFGPGADIPHGIVSAVALCYRNAGLLTSSGMMGRGTAAALARAIGGHHGVWPSATDMRNAYDASYQPAWETAREVLFSALRELYQPPSLPDEIDTRTKAFNAFLMLVSGFTTVADWIGSMSEYFPLRQDWLGLEAYRQIARGQAEKALKETGWMKEGHDVISSVSFADLLPDTETEPNPVQQSVLAAVAGVEGQTLTLLEAPTGIGKTELAFYLCSQLLDKEALEGLYVAMPTQATSNQMHGRTARFLQTRYPEQALAPRLLHSQAMWQIDARMQIPGGIYDNDGAGQFGTTSTWFLPKKRGLLEPFAVGTVDQTLLSVLWTRHFFVRLFGLRRKVLIFDEVHAYDTYMNELFMILLAWMRWLGSSVIILSATLPNASRRKLIAQFGGAGSALDATDQCNARLTLVNADGRTLATSLDAATEQRIIQVEWITEEALTTMLEDVTREGGCVAVICNTVRRAQETYRVLKEAQAGGALAGCELSLFHARYPAAWRQGIETRAAQQFGREGPRPRRAILVATQVIEQSLDLDFDLLITEMPPIDLLIQRIGRLHRHRREDRPSPLNEPRVLILTPVMQDDLPTFGASEYVYARFLLIASWAALQDRSSLFLPDQSRELIETVYGEGWQALPNYDALADAQQEVLIQQDQDQYKASLKHIPLPDSDRLLDGHNTGLDEDDPTLHKEFQALTRDIEPTVQVICLHQVGTTLSLEPDGTEPVDLRRKPDSRRLLRYVVSISNKIVFGAICESAEFDLPKAWNAEAALKYHRLAVFEGNLCRVAGTRFVLRLSREYGLEIMKEDEL